MNHGLSEKTVNKILSVFERFPEIEKAVLYGSRAKGNFKTGSDIDLTLYGEKLSSRLLGDIAEALDDLLLPYTIDLSIFDDLNHAKLREHIERVGVVFYEKKNQNMKAGWEIKTLGEVCEVFADGDWIESKDQAPDGIRLVQTGNVGDGVFKDKSDKARYISAETFKRLRCTEVFEGDCLISRLPDPIGRSCILPDTGEQMITSVDCTIVRFDKNKIIPNFFNYYSQSYDYLNFVNSEATGATRKRIGRSKLAQTLIPVPPLPEQKRLVTLLDEAFESIATAKANAEQNLKNARALFESHLNEVFAECAKKYGHKTVGEISKHSLGKMLDKAKNKGEFKPYLRNINVRWFNFDLSDTLEMKFLPEETEKYTAVKGDVLICEGGYPGRAAIWQSDEPIFFQKALHRVRFHEIEHNKWFVYFLFSQDSSGCLRQHFTGAGIQHFTGSALKQFKIPIPPIEETKFYVAKFDALSQETQHLESLYSRKITALDELKKALLHRAFSGEL